MKAVVLAAGKGERLEPITHTRPKPFVPVLDTPLILRNIRIVKKYVNDVVIVINSNHKEYFKLIEGVSLVEQTEGKGTAAALLAVEKYLERDDEFLVIYGDLLFEEEAVEKIVNTNGEAILATESDDPKKYGVIVKDSENRLVRIVEKPENPPSKLINAGIYKLAY